MVEKLSSEEFEPETYSDEYRNRVLAMLDEKQKGREVTIAPPASQPSGVVDLMEALKRSMREMGSAKDKTRSRNNA